jgi:multidrug transporter EmrE-like cation transporter
MSARCLPAWLRSRCRGRRLLVVMHYLLLHIVCVLHFSQLLRLGQKRSCRSMSVVGVNYALAAMVSACAAVFLGAWSAQGVPMLTALGVVNGVLFVLHVLVMMAAFRLAGTGITWAFVGAGVIMPVLAARFLWDEEMSRMQWLALGLVPLAVALLRPPRKAGEAAKHVGLKGDVILLLCFLMAGAIATLNKAQDVYIKALPGAQEAGVFLSRERLVFQTALFVTTAVLSVGYMIARRMWPTRKETAVGLAVGLANNCGLFFALLAINAVAATVFFPTAGCLVIAGNTVLGRFFWKEKLTVKQALGLAVALGIVALANLRATS